jgi:hypothetical protein
MMEKSAGNLGGHSELDLTGARHRNELFPTAPATMEDTMSYDQDLDQQMESHFFPEEATGPSSDPIVRLRQQRDQALRERNEARTALAQAKDLLDAALRDRDEARADHKEALDAHDAAIRERDEARAGWLPCRACGATGEVHTCDYCHQSALRERDDARAELGQARHMAAELQRRVGGICQWCHRDPFR